MKIVYDTGQGIIELDGEYALYRVRSARRHNVHVISLAVRTHQVKSVGCILAINKPLDEFIATAPPAVLVIGLDEPFKGFSKLSDKWLKGRRFALTKTAALPEEKFWDFLEEFYALQSPAQNANSGVVEQPI